MIAAFQWFTRIRRPFYGRAEQSRVPPGSPSRCPSARQRQRINRATYYYYNPRTVPVIANARAQDFWTQVFGGTKLRASPLNACSRKRICINVRNLRQNLPKAKFSARNSSLDRRASRFPRAIDNIGGRRTASIRLRWSLAQTMPQISADSFVSLHTAERAARRLSWA
jgi:hypothetical protein